MRASLKSLPKVFESEEGSVRGADWGDMHVEVDVFDKEFDVTPFLKGLPNDLDQCPHWGYVIRGGLRVRYPDREETIREGEAYYIAPNHTLIASAGTECIEFSPKDKFARTMEAVERNMAVPTGG